MKLTIKYCKPKTLKLNTLGPKIGHDGLENFKLDIPNYKIWHGRLKIPQIGHGKFETFWVGHLCPKIGHKKLKPSNWIPQTLKLNMAYLNPWNWISKTFKLDTQDLEIGHDKLGILQIRYPILKNWTLYTWNL